MKVRYFAWLRNRTGCAQEELELPPEVTSVAGLMAVLALRHPGFGEAMQTRGVVRCAVNQTYVERDATLRPADEVAFFPPVTGG
jgi:molybdopterin synthase sulfur carrier subunit